MGAAARFHFKTARLARKASRQARMAGKPKVSRALRFAATAHKAVGQRLKRAGL